MAETKSESTIAKVSTQAPSQLFLIFVLFLTCLNLLANNLLNQTIRSNIAYWVPFLKLDSASAKTIKDLPTWLHVPVVLLAIPSGYLTDMLGAPVALVAFSVLNAGGIVLIIASASRRLAAHWYVVGMLFYGAALNLGRLPMQKIASVLFQGPNLAFAMNINHSFSHIASILSNVLATPLFAAVGVPLNIVFLASISLFSLPICLTLYALYTSKISLKGDSSGKASLLDSLKKVFQLDSLFWLVLVTGIFIDGPNVAFKNTESDFFKQGLHVKMEDMNSMQAFSKIFLLFSPLFSMLVDKYTYRQYYLFAANLSNIGVFLAYIIMLKTGSHPYWLLLTLSIVQKIGQSFFYASFYSFYAVLIDKKIRGAGLGLIATVLNAVYFLLPNTATWLGLSVEWKAYVYFILYCIGCGLTILLILVNWRKGDLMNKDRLAREASLQKTRQETEISSK